MKKNILNLKDVQQLNKEQQLSILGGKNQASVGCVLISPPFASCSTANYIVRACSTSSFTGFTRCMDGKEYCCDIVINP